MARRRDGKALNQRQLAASLNLSQAAVSKALRGAADISAATRERVMAAAAAHGYRPNPLARSLNGGRSGLVGMVTRRFMGAHFLRMQIALFEGFERLGLAPLVNVCGPRPGEREAVELLRRYRVDGVVLLETDPRATHEALDGVAGEGLPVVVIGHEGVPGAANILSAEEKGSRELVAELIALGHRRIAHWGPWNPGGWPLRGRCRGYLAALRAAGIPWSPELEIPPASDPAREAHETIVEAYLRAHPDTTAICCDVDDTALAAIAVLRRLGRNVPGDVSVTGFGDNLKYPDDMAVPVTTVSHQPERTAKLAVELLERGIGGEPIAGDYVVPTRLIRRSSVGPAPILSTHKAR